MSQLSSAIEEERAKSGFSFIEDLAAGGLQVSTPLKNIVFRGESEYQKVDIIETWFGKTLLTDGKTQSAKCDERIYHEALVHPALLKVKDCKSVFIGGGGELATAREVLKHSSVERVVMVDLDKVVVEMCQKWLPEWGNGATDDPRLDLIIGDAYAWMMNTDEMFDAIIMDISDPTEAGPGIKLYTQEFYSYAATRLNSGGVFVTQAGVAEPVIIATEHSNTCWGAINRTLDSVFDCAIPYYAQVLSFGGKWGYVMAFNQTEESRCESTAAQASNEWRRPRDGLIDTLIEEKITGGKSALEFYDGDAHLGMTCLAKFVRHILGRDERLMTMENPVFMY
mmetsp:Transcript_13727/g.20978  ORF Transcript_13727/g.20978 Transcript_13727/m.20978 type:complete len:338 (-) Transcript_13727:170-1183(-)